MAKPNVVSKQELLRSAQQCVARQGLQALTLKAVAEGANVTPGTVYYHFRSKEQLLLELVQEMCHRSWQHLETDADTADGFLEAALDSAKSRCSHESLYHRLFFSLVAAGFHQEKLRAELSRLLQEENDALASQIRRHWHAEQLGDISAESWALLMNALIDGLALQALLSPTFDAERAYADLEKLIRRQLLPQGGASA
jgi:AcrR family transcriptional regulator